MPAIRHQREGVKLTFNTWVKRSSSLSCPSPGWGHLRGKGRIHSTPLSFPRLGLEEEGMSFLWLGGTPS